MMTTTSSVPEVARRPLMRSQEECHALLASLASWLRCLVVVGRDGGGIEGARDTFVSTFLACLGIGEERKRNPAPRGFSPFIRPTVRVRPHIISKLAIQAAVSHVPRYLRFAPFCPLIPPPRKIFCCFLWSPSK